MAEERRKETYQLLQRVLNETSLSPLTYVDETSTQTKQKHTNLEEGRKISEEYLNS